MNSEQRALSNEQQWNEDMLEKKQLVSSGSSACISFAASALKKSG